MLSFGKFPHWWLCSTPQKWPDHYLIPSLNRLQVLVVLSSGLTPMDTILSSNFTLMVLDLQLPSVHQFYSPFSLVTTTICFNSPRRRSSTMASVINWTHWTHGRKQFSLINTRPTKTHNLNKNRSCSNHHQQLFPLSKLFRESEGFLIDGASYREIKFSDLPVLKPQIQTSLIFHFS